MFPSHQHSRADGSREPRQIPRAITIKAWTRNFLLFSSSSIRFSVLGRLVGARSSFSTAPSPYYCLIFFPITPILLLTSRLPFTITSGRCWFSPHHRKFVLLYFHHIFQPCMFSGNEECLTLTGYTLAI